MTYTVSSGTHVTLPYLQCFDTLLWFDDRKESAMQKSRTNNYQGSMGDL